MSGLQNNTIQRKLGTAKIVPCYNEFPCYTVEPRYKEVGYNKTLL